MKHLLAISLYTLCALSLKAQQSLHYSLSHTNPYFYNPAYAGLSGKISANMITKYQWVGITDSPRSFALSANGPVKGKENIIIGGNISYEQAGAENITKISLSYTQKFKLSESLNLNLSAAAGITNYNINFLKINHLSNPLDRVINNQSKNSLTPHILTGFTLYHKKFTVGGAYKQLLFESINSLSDDTFDLNGLLLSHMYFMASYSQDIGEKFNLKPFLLVKSTINLDIQPTLIARLTYDKKVWIAPEFTYNSHFGSSIGVILNQYHINFAYTYNYNAINSATIASYEVGLGIDFN